jgi:hypothetical protein
LYRINQQLDLTGTAWLWIIPNQLGDKIVEMYVVPTALAIPLPVQTPEYPEGAFRIQPVYPYGPFSSYPLPNSAAGATIPAEWMIPIQYPHPLLWFDGYSPMTGIKMHIDEVEAVDRSRWYDLKRQVKPSAVLQQGGEAGASPLPESEIDRIQVEWENMQTGAENVGKLLVSGPGARVSRGVIPPTR